MSKYNFCSFSFNLFMYSSNKLEIKKYLFVVAWREGGWRGAVSVAGEKGVLPWCPNKGSLSQHFYPPSRVWKRPSSGRALDRSEEEKTFFQTFINIAEGWVEGRATPLSSAPAYGVLVSVLVWPRLWSWKEVCSSSLEAAGPNWAAGGGGMPKQKSKVGFPRVMHQVRCWKVLWNINNSRWCVWVGFAKENLASEIDFEVEAVAVVGLSCFSLVENSAWDEHWLGIFAQYLSPLRTFSLIGGYSRSTLYWVWWGIESISTDIGWVNTFLVTFYPWLKGVENSALDVFLC